MKRFTRLCAATAMTGVGLLAGCQSTQDAAPGSVAWKPKMNSSSADEGGPIDLELSLARTLERDGDLTKAASAYRQILYRYPNQPVALHRLAVVLDQSQRFDESAPLYEQALAASPDDPELLCDCAFSLYLRDDLPRAESMLRQALKHSPGHKRSHNHLGLILARTDRLDEAVHEFHAAGCSATQAHENIGLVLSIDGRLVESRAAYAAALDVDSGSKRVRERLAELDTLIAGTPTGGGQTADYAVPPAGALEPDGTGRATVQLTGFDAP